MKNGKIRIRWRNVLLGIGVGMLMLVCGCAAAAGLMAKGAVELIHMDLFAAGILTLAALSGCLAALPGGGGNVDGALVAVGELVVLVGLNMALNGGKMEGIWRTIPVLAGGYGGAVLLSLKGAGRGKGHRRRRKNR